MRRGLLRPIVGYLVTTVVLVGPTAANAQIRFAERNSKAVCEPPIWNEINVTLDIDPGPNKKLPFRWDIEVVHESLGPQYAEGSQGASLTGNQMVSKRIPIPVEGRYTVRATAQYYGSTGGPGTAQYETTVLCKRKKPEVYALIIAIDYKGKEKEKKKNEKSDKPRLRQLYFPDRDGDAFYYFLTEILQVPRDHVVRLTSTEDSDPAASIYPGTKDNIIDLFEEVGKKVGPDDIVVIYYSGHGVRGIYDWYLAPVSAELVSWNEIKERTFISMSYEWETILRPLKRAKHLVILIDACFSGAAAGPDASVIRGVYLGPLGEESAIPPPIQKPTSESRIIFTATTEYQPAYEVFFKEGRWKFVLSKGDENRPQEGAHGHGFFTYSLLKAAAALAQEKIPLDLTGEGLCGGKPCVKDRERISTVMKSEGVKFPLSSLYDRLEEFMKAFEEEYNKTKPPGDRIVQRPRDHTLASGAKPVLRHYNLMQESNE